MVKEHSMPYSLELLFQTLHFENCKFLSILSLGISKKTGRHRHIPIDMLPCVRLSNWTTNNVIFTTAMSSDLPLLVPLATNFCSCNHIMNWMDSLGIYLTELRYRQKRAAFTYLPSILMKTARKIKTLF